MIHLGNALFVLWRAFQELTEELLPEDGIAAA